MKIQSKNFKDEIKEMLIKSVIIPIIAVAIFAYIMIIIGAYYLIRKQNIDNNKEISTIFEANIVEYKKNIKELSEDKQIISSVNSREPSVNTFEVLYKFVNSRNVKSDFYIFDSNGELLMGSKTTRPLYLQNENIFSWGIFKRMKSSPEKVVKMVNRATYLNNQISMFTMAKAIVSENEIIGYMLFDFSEDEIFKMIKGADQSDWLITENHNIIASTNNKYSDHLYKLKNSFRNNSGFNNIENKNYYIYVNDIKDTTMTIYTVTNLDFINRSFIIGAIFLTILFCTIFVVMIIMSSKLAYSKTKSIDIIVQAIKNVQKGNLDFKLDLETNDEFQFIAGQFNKMVYEIKALIERNEDEMKLRMNSEIKQLQSQFNPHFLFNTLEVIRVMIKIDKEAANSIIINLSSLLRYSINNENNLVLLNKDIQYINSYLEILKYRFGDKLTFDFTIDKGLLNSIVPKLIFQPIIENTIQHGFNSKSKLNISVDIKLCNKDTIITIKDDGDGIESKRLKDLENILNGKSNNSENLGLYNVHKRIKLIYGKDYGMKINSIENLGTEVRIKIPCVRGDNFV